VIYGRFGRERTRHCHFEVRGIRVAGRTAAGRATVEVLNMNAAARLELRAELLSAGRLG
jgi:hypothetical protein